MPEYNIVVGFNGAAMDEGIYEQIILDYILYQITDPPEGDPIPEAIPGFSLNVILLTILCTTVIVIVKRRKSSKN